MKLKRGKYRAVAKANRLSPEIFMMSVADTVHLGAGSSPITVIGEGIGIRRGLR